MNQSRNIEYVNVLETKHGTFYQVHYTNNVMQLLTEEVFNDKYNTSVQFKLHNYRGKIKDLHKETGIKLVGMLNPYALQVEYDGKYYTVDIKK